MDQATQLRVSECGKALAIACTKAMATGGAINLPTLVAACARMSGSYLLRSFGLNLERLIPGQVVLSSPAGEKTQTLLRFCAAVLQSFGTVLPSAPSASLPDAAAALKQSFLDSQILLEPVFVPLKLQFALSDEEMAKAGAVATGALIHQFAKHMDPAAGFNYASYGFTEGTRTVPAPVAPNAA
jgi:hypothetical protein